MQESTKTSSNWVAAVLNEVQRGGGKVAVDVRLWHNLSSQETRCKFLWSHLNSPVPVAVAHIFPIDKCLNILYPAKNSLCVWMVWLAELRVPGSLLRMLRAGWALPKVEMNTS